MLENRKQLEHSIRSLAKMYEIRNRDAAETLYDPETREDVVESTISMIRKIEREVAEYLATHLEERQEGEEVAEPRREVAAPIPIAPTREPVAA